MLTTVDVARDTTWDVVVIGTGMGGATAGFALARAGKSVLFLDKGRARSPSTLQGAYAEQFPDGRALGAIQDRGVLAAAGREWEPIEDVSRTRARSFIPFTGAGIGGSSALYGMALERFFPCDFTPRENFPNARQSALPERWPVAFDELLPFYEEAEALFGVRGTQDPLRSTPATHLAAPPMLSSAGDELFAALKERGLHPYRIPLACDFVDDCASCQGYLCSRACKNDGGRVCVEPALAMHESALLDRCEVVRISTTKRSVDAVECVRDGERFRVRAGIFVLAAGAIATPALLLRSASSEWPDGLANRSQQVGRNLMRHLIDLYAVRPTVDGFDNRRKELAFNDFYLHDGVKLGSVQSFGRLPPASVIACDVALDVRRTMGALAAHAFRVVSPLLERSLAPLIERHLMFAGIVEDLPYAYNRITVAQASTRIHYQLDHDARSRVDVQRSLIVEAFRPRLTRLLKQAANNARIAHACGTCRFGHDPKTSVLDANNRCHDVANLYIVDASFFPSSGGTNPGLTIAANALRVATHIAVNRTDEVPAQAAPTKISHAKVTGT